MTHDETVVVLNEPQRHHIRASCQYIDRLLSDLEAAVASASSGSPFARYVDDLTPAHKRLVRDYSAAVRAEMLRVMRSFEIALTVDRSSVRHAVRSGLGFVEIALEEIKPQYMRGYGEMPPAAVPVLTGLVVELQTLVHRFEASLVAGAVDLGARIARLGEGGIAAALAAVEQAIERHALVEFRPALENVLDRCDTPRFEIAVFGRVSSGKSTLLNYLAGSSILPVGVTPVTAVPTRLARGDEDGVLVEFADRKAERVPIARLAEFVTEDGNPDNVRHVVRVAVTLADTAIPEGIVFVDTPGLGSLATEGAAETLAYLPRCDLGVVLVDATAPLTADDVGTVARLSEAGIPALVVLSKVDLVAAADRVRVTEYVVKHLQRELGVAIAVHGVSTAPAHSSLADRWLDDELRPRMADHRALLEASLARKVTSLAAGVKGALRARIGRRGTSAPATVDAERVERDLRHAASLFEDVRTLCESLRNPPQRELTEALDLAAERATTALDYPESVPAGVDAAIRNAIAQTAVDFADDVRRPLGVVVERVAASLVEAADAVGAPRPATLEAWTRLMREMPSFVWGETHVDLRMPFRKALGKGVAFSRVRTAIAAQIGERVEHALRAHGLALHEWSLGVVSRVRHEFGAEAEMIRSQLGHGPDSGHTETLEQDVAALDALTMPDVPATC